MRWARFLYRIKVFYRYHRHGPRDVTPLFVISTARSGSKLLISLLNSHSRISMKKEILSDTNYEGLSRLFHGRGQMLRHIKYGVMSRNAQYAGVKLQLSQMNKWNITPHNLCEFFPTARFIILYRQNIIEQFLSLQRARKTGKWHKTSSGSKSRHLEKTYFDIGAFRRFCNYIKRAYTNLKKYPELKNRSIIVSYEDLVEKGQNWFDGTVFPFLHLEPEVLGTNLVKLNRWPLEKSIENYHEIQSLLDDPQNCHRFLW